MTTIAAGELATRRAPIVAADVSTRTVTARLVTWGLARRVADPDGARYEETFARGSLVPLPDVYVVDEHGGSLIGHAANHRDDGTGHIADLVIADTSAGRDLMALVDAGTVSSVSIEFDQRGGNATWNAQRSACTRHRAELHGVAFAFRPAHLSPIVAVRHDTPPEEPVLTTTRALELDEGTLRRELHRALVERPAARIDLDPYADGEHCYLRDVVSEATSGGFGALEERRRLKLHRALTDITTVTDPGLITPGLSRLSVAAVNPVTAAPFLNAYAVRAEPYDSLKLPGLPTVVPDRQATEKTEVESGGHISDSVVVGDPAVTVAWGADISTQALVRAPEAWLTLLFTEVGAALFAKADTEALADLAATTGIGTATDLLAAIGTVVAAQPSDRPPLVVLGTANLSELAGLRELIEAGLVRLALSSTLPAGLKAIVVGGRAVMAMRTDLQMVQAYDVLKLGANVAWYVQYAMTARAPAAVVKVTTA